MQPTEKLYEADSFARTCDSTVLAVQTDDKGTRVALDRTVFYPEGGGQPCDTGVMRFAGGEVDVTDVRIKEGVIWHTLSALPEALKEGCAVQGEIDFFYRFDRMQQHTGEHILSGTLHRLFGAENVGFHIGSDAVRMDTSVHLTDKQLWQAETEANAVIWADTPVEILYPDAETLARMTYRSKKEIDGQVRIVRIEGADTCACCGTHMRSAGQVGLIKLVASEHYKGGERLTLLCGARALREMQAMRHRQQRIGALLSAMPAATADAVERVYNEYNSLKFIHVGTCFRLFEALAAQLTPGEPAVYVLPDLSPDELHRCAETLCAHTDALCAALTPNPKGTGYCLARAGSDIRPLCKALNAAFAGRGGGKPNLCQGSCTAGTPEEIAAWLTAAAHE